MGTYLTVQKFSEDRMLGIGKAFALSIDATAAYVDVANTTRHIYAVGQPLLLENEDGYQEEATIGTILYGTGGTAHRITFSAVLSDHTKFTTAKSANVRINQYFDALTIPKSSTIETWIGRAERRIDEHCHTSWMERTWRGTIPFDPEVLRWYIGDYSARYAFKLPYAGVTVPLASGSGDILKYWNGATWVDALAAGWVYGRDADYWIDADFMFFVNTRPRISRRSIDMGFRYDEGDVPEDIGEACSKLVAREYLRGNPRNVDGSAKPASGEQWPYQSGAPSWAEIKGILHPHVKIVYGV